MPEYGSGAPCRGRTRCLSAHGKTIVGSVAGLCLLRGVVPLPCGQAVRVFLWWLGSLMAIAYLRVDPISRAAGYSAVGAAAYRTRSEMLDARTGERFDWSRRGDELEHTGLVVPQTARGWVSDRRAAGMTPQAIRAALWNGVEKAEKRKDSKVAHECTIALPWELSSAQRQTLNHKIARLIAERHGVAVEYAAHLPHLNASAQHSDERNYHVHFLITTRRLTAQGLGDKARELDVPKTSGAHIEAWRAGAQELINEALHKAGYAEHRIDMRSYERQGVARKGQIHMGPQATARQRKGLETDVADHNATVRQENAQRTAQEQRARLTEKSNVIDFEKKRQDRALQRRQAALFRESLKNRDRLPKALQRLRQTEERLRAERLESEQRQRDAEAQRLREEAQQRERERHAQFLAQRRDRLEGLRQRLHTAMERRYDAAPERKKHTGFLGWLTGGLQSMQERLGKFFGSLPGAASPARSVPERPEPSGKAPMKTAVSNQRPEGSTTTQQRRPQQSQAPPARPAGRTGMVRTPETPAPANTNEAAAERLRAALDRMEIVPGQWSKDIPPGTDPETAKAVKEIFDRMAGLEDSLDRHRQRREARQQTPPEDYAHLDPDIAEKMRQLDERLSRGRRGPRMQP